MNRNILLKKTQAKKQRKFGFYFCAQIFQCQQNTTVSIIGHWKALEKYFESDRCKYVGWINSE